MINLPCKVTKITSTMMWLALLTGLLLSFLSGFNICNSMCSETAKYAVFGYDFGWIGAAYFSFLLLLLALRRRIPTIGILLYYSIIAAAGAEVRLVWIQKYDIGVWCPVCLSIAAVVAVATIVSIRELTAAGTIPGGQMKVRFIQIYIVLVAVLLGFGSAFVLVQKEAEASELNIYLGKQKSDTTVYFISDWFCTVCRKMEPEIEKMYPEIKKSVRVAFVDMPIHPESANITPYNLQFMLHEKDKYIMLRNALDELSRKTNNPTQDQVQKAMSPHGVTLRAPDFMEIMNGVRQFESVYKGFNISGTPTVIVDNARTKKHKLLVGSTEISVQAIRSAISAVEK